MVRCLIIGVLICSLSPKLIAQTDQLETGKMMEKYAEYTGSSADFLDLYDQLSTYQNKKININKASLEDLVNFILVGQQRASEIVNYRNTYGDFISLLELQALPNFTIDYIKIILPYISVSGADKFILKEVLKNSKNDIIILGQYNDISYLQPISPTDSNRVLGDGSRALVRYRFGEPGKLSIGITAEKDAGELWPFQKNGMRAGFLSAHLYIKPNGRIIKEIAIGDYQVNFGQGLTFSSGLSFGKSALVLNTYRATEGIRPYRSVNENQFMRGAAFALNLLKKTKLTIFGSLNKDDVSIDENGQAGSINNFGYIRTLKDISQKNNQSIAIIGFNMQQQLKKFIVGVTVVNQHFNIPFAKQDRLYAKNRLAGNELLNAGFDYKGNIKNMFFYGEMSVNNLSENPAMIHGVLVSLSKRWSANLIYRNFPASYKSIYATAWGEQTNPNNERAFYTAIQYEWHRHITLSLFADIIRFPWARFRDAAAGYQNDYFIEAKHTFNKYMLHYLRLRHTSFTDNISNTNSAAKLQQNNQRLNIRYHIDIDKPGNVALAFRAEIVQLDNEEKKVLGSLFFADIGYKSKQGKLKIVGRYTLFNTPDFDSRIYAYENDVLYAFSIPAMYGNGNRVYAVVTAKLYKGLTFWGKFTFEKNTRKSTLDQLNFNPLGRMQIRYTW